MSMVWIRDEDENWFIRTHAGRKFNLRIGAEWNERRNRFQWKNGRELTYTNWDPDSSKRLNPSCTDSTGCQVIMKFNGFWQIDNCSNNSLHYTVCRKRIAAPLMAVFRSTEKATSHGSENISQNDSKMNEFHTCNHSSISWIDVLNLILNMIAIYILCLLFKMSIGKKKKKKKKEKQLPIGWSPSSYGGNDNDSGFNVSFTRVWSKYQYVSKYPFHIFLPTQSMEKLIREWFRYTFIQSVWNGENKLIGTNMKCPFRFIRLSFFHTCSMNVSIDWKKCHKKGEWEKVE